MTTRKTLEISLDALETLKQYGPSEPSFGICGNINRGSLNGPFIVRKYAIDWDEYSGDPDCPIPSFDETKDPYEMYISTQVDKWSKSFPYGRARWRLVDYLIKRVSADLQQMPA